MAAMPSNRYVVVKGKGRFLTKESYQIITWLEFYLDTQQLSQPHHSDNALHVGLRYSPMGVYCVIQLIHSSMVTHHTVYSCLLSSFLPKC